MRLFGFFRRPELSKNDTWLQVYLTSRHQGDDHDTAMRNGDQAVIRLFPAG